MMLTRPIFWVPALRKKALRKKGLRKTGLPTPRLRTTSLRAGRACFAAVVVTLAAGVLAAFAWQPAKAATGAQSASRTQAPPASSTEAMDQAAAQRADAKLRHLEANARRAAPDQAPTVFTDFEINAYLSSGQVALPEGVRSVRFAFSPGQVDGTATVDFDAITARQRSSNPLLAIFSGTHLVEAVAHGSGSGHQARLHIDSVSLDGVGVPRLALQLFVDHYLKPRYPNIGLDSTFAMPEHIDQAIFGRRSLTVTQK